jgi:hypothetical protein
MLKLYGTIYLLNIWIKIKKLKKQHIEYFGNNKINNQIIYNHGYANFRKNSYW